MPEGGTIAISVENFVVDEAYVGMHPEAKIGSYVALSVTDTGTGIPPEVLSKIFEPFFTTKTLGSGTGLGLSTVMAIVKNNNGFINVYSEVGRGTTIRSCFPAVHGPPTEMQAGATTEISPRGKGETILVVDDEASILAITGQTLEAFGYVPLTAHDGAHAVSLYTHDPNRIALVLTDMSMPVMDGPATIRALRAINPAVRIIGTSGLKTNAIEAQQGDLRVDYFLSKPYTTEALLKVLRQALDRTVTPSEERPSPTRD
jgi:CheY-like chemotaxis protein